VATNAIETALLYFTIIVFGIFAVVVIGTEFERGGLTGVYEKYGTVYTDKKSEKESREKSPEFMI